MRWCGSWFTKKTQGGFGFHQPAESKAEHLNLILERERTRADRTGRPLSMVLLGYDGNTRSGLDAATIVEAMNNRRRITDEIGRFDKKTGFAVLPDTPAPGGRRFAQIVQQQLRELGVQTSFAIYQYDPPREKDPEDQNDQDQHGHNGRSNRRRRGLSSAAVPVSGLAPEAGFEKEPTHSAGLVQPQETVHELQPFMARGLPWWKRGTDLAVAGSALLMIWPLLLVIAAVIKLDSPGPVIFKQKRSGLAGRAFGIWKFRTMVPDAEAKRNELLAINEQDGPAFKIKADPRITRVGSFLRKTSLDELPQLVNIILGDMTLVGPRPLPLQESDACEPWQKRRLDITPGLTCIWQVWGRSRVNFNDWVRMDLRYQRQRTPHHDLKIMLHTVPAVLKQRGAC